MQNLSSNKLVLVTTILIALIIPITVIATTQQTHSNSKANEVLTPPPTFSTEPSLYPPMLIPFEFSDANKFSTYQFTVSGRDKDQYDLLKITTTGLPKGLNLTDCSYGNQNGTSITCSVFGKPEETGSFTVTVTITDKMGNMGKLSRKLFVKEWHQQLPLFN